MLASHDQKHLQTSGFMSYKEKEKDKEVQYNSLTSTERYVLIIFVYILKPMKFWKCQIFTSILLKMKNTSS